MEHELSTSKPRDLGIEADEESITDRLSCKMPCGVNEPLKFPQRRVPAMDAMAGICWAAVSMGWKKSK
jgi:hypothetical protein